MSFSIFAVLFFTLGLAVPGRAQSEAEKLYKAKCAVCHANDGSGDTPIGKKMKMRDLRSPEIQKLTDGQLHEAVAKGTKGMPGYEKSLKDTQIKELVAYMRELAKQKEKQKEKEEKK
jgi:mono/diheme cytochrome c family protein